MEKNASLNGKKEYRAMWFWTDGSVPFSGNETKQRLGGYPIRPQFPRPQEDLGRPMQCGSGV